MDFENVLGYLEEFNPDLPEISDEYGTSELSQLFRCNVNTVRNLVYQRHLRAKRVNSRNHTGDIAVAHGEVLRFAADRRYLIRRDVERILFREGVVSTIDLTSPLGCTTINVLDMVIDKSFPRFNFSSSPNFLQKPYYRLSIPETKRKLFEVWHDMEYSLLI